MKGLGAGTNATLEEEGGSKPADAILSYSIGFRM
jgi:hypothetical protein